MKNARMKARFAFFLTLSLLAAVSTASAAANASAGPEPAKLVGSWSRTEGGYMLHLSDPGPNGELQATYFNPKPVHVALAAWKHESGYLGAFVELRAPNYPGSTYTLVYDANKDRLVGIYFHAGLQQEFQVEFVRTP